MIAFKQKKKTVREYVKKTERGNTSLEVMEEAARRVIDGKESLRTVAADFNVSCVLKKDCCWF